MKILSDTVRGPKLDNEPDVERDGDEKYIVFNVPFTAAKEEIFIVLFTAKLSLLYNEPYTIRGPST